MEHSVVFAAWQRCAIRLLPPSAFVPQHDSFDSLKEPCGTLSSMLYAKYIFGPYSETGRFYHSLSHIDSMLSSLAHYHADKVYAEGDPTLSGVSKREGGPWDLLTMELSILFHDVVYDATRNDNEEKSVVWMNNFLNEARAYYREALVKVPGPTPPASCYAAASEDAREQVRDTIEQTGLRSETLSHGSLYSADIYVRATDPDALCAKWGDGHSMILWDNPDQAAAVPSEVASRIMATTNHMKVRPICHLSRDALGDTVAQPDGSVGVPTVRTHPSLLFPRHPIFPDLHVFLDLDLAVLGLPEETYFSTYAHMIRSEYAHLSPTVYLKGRTAVLGNMLAEEQLYKTPYYFYQLEAQARANMLREIELLNGEMQDCPS